MLRPNSNGGQIGHQTPQTPLTNQTRLPTPVATSGSVALNPLMNHSSTPTLYPLEKIGKTSSVTSLSVGVQYDPRDVVKQQQQQHPQPRYSASGSAASITASENEYNIPGDGLRRGSHHRKTHIHLSAPDFCGNFEMSTRRHGTHRHHASHSRGHNLLTTSASLGGHHHHHHHLHHKTSINSTGTRTLTTPGRDFMDHNSSAGQHTLRRTRDHYEYFGSLGRGGHRHPPPPPPPPPPPSRGGIYGGAGADSESDPDLWGPAGLSTPPPLKSARLSLEGTKSSRTTSARRYGSIRVAECSFIEAGAESQPSTPTDQPSYNNQRQRQYSLSYCLPSEPHTNPAVSLAPGGVSKADHRTLPTSAGSAGALCNGPLGGLNEGHRGRPPPPPPPRPLQPPQYSNNGQQSHIIPPPHNFSSNGDYAPLTTTRIGSSLNLSSRPPPQASQPQWTPQQSRRSSIAHLGSQAAAAQQASQPNSPPF